MVAISKLIAYASASESQEPKMLTQLQFFCPAKKKTFCEIIIQVSTTIVSESVINQSEWQGQAMTGFWSDKKKTSVKEVKLAGSCLLLPPQGPLTQIVSGSYYTSTQRLFHLFFCLAKSVFDASLILTTFKRLKRGSVQNSKLKIFVFWKWKFCTCFHYIGHYCSWVHLSSKRALSHSPPSRWFLLIKNAEMVRWGNFV